MAYDSVTIDQPKDWLLVLYMAFSFFLMIVLLIIKIKDVYANSIYKALGFFIIFSLGASQYFVLRFGLSPLYKFIGLMPKDNLFIRICALMFMLAYFYCLPFKRPR